MDNYIEITQENIIKESVTTKTGYCDKKYIIYINENDKRQKVRVNTNYHRVDNIFKLCRYYDRGLCDSMEEYANLSLEYIEIQAYGSWMDGAR